MASETQIYAIGTCAIGILANRPNAQKFTSPETPPMEKMTKSLTIFMQNKPNFQKSQMNANSCARKDYENKSNWTLGENKPNSKPIKANLKRAKMDVNIYYTEVYENILCIRQSMKTNPNKANSLKAQINANSLVIKDYENRWQRRVSKNKANQSQFKNPAPKEREEKKVSGKLLKKQFYFFMSQNGPIPHYIARTQILREYSRCRYDRD